MHPNPKVVDYITILRNSKAAFCSWVDTGVSLKLLQTLCIVLTIYWSHFVLRWLEISHKLNLVGVKVLCCMDLHILSYAMVPASRWLAWMSLLSFLILLFLKGHTLPLWVPSSLCRGIMEAITKLEPMIWNRNTRITYPCHSYDVQNYLVSMDDPQKAT